MAELTSRSDALLAERALNQAWDMSQEEWDEIKQCVLRLARWPAKSKLAFRCWARAGALGIAMKNANIKMEQQRLSQESSQRGPTMVVNGDVNLTVSREAVQGMLQARKDLLQRSKAEVIDQTPISSEEMKPGAVVTPSSLTPLPSPLTPSPIATFGHPVQIGLKELPQNNAE